MKISVKRVQIGHDYKAAVLVDGKEWQVFDSIHVAKVAARNLKRDVRIHGAAAL